jgi:ABC-type multidrug transport system ATPase subunit
MAAPALEVIDVTVRYRTGYPGRVSHVAALDRASMVAAAGECVGVVGGLGAGKTTLLLCAAGILNPDSGSVRRANAEYVGRTGGAHPYLSVRASLDFAASVRELAGWDGDPDPQRILATVGLTELANARLGQLDAGAHARLLLAHALVTGPGLLSLDDPLESLTTAERRRYGVLVDELCAGGMAVLISARDAHLLDGIASRVLAIHGGRLAQTTGGPRTLELDVTMPARAAAVLADRLPSVRRRGDALRIPLERVSAEEVLSACLALGISVHGSRVITAVMPSRVAEGKEEARPDPAGVPPASGKP